jgi:hypothetical protein
MPQVSAPLTLCREVHGHLRERKSQSTNVASSFSTPFFPLFSKDASCQELHQSTKLQSDLYEIYICLMIYFPGMHAPHQ